MKMFVATVLRDYSEDEYLTVCEEPFLTREEAEDYIKKIRGHVKFVKEIGEDK